MTFGPIQLGDHLIKKYVLPIIPLEDPRTRPQLSSPPTTGSSAKPPVAKPPVAKPPLGPIGIDTNGDGKPDIIVTPKPGIGIDTDGDGIIDISFPKEPPSPQPPTAKPPDGKSPDVKPPDVKPPIFKQPSEPLLLGPDGLPVIALPPRKDH